MSIFKRKSAPTSGNGNSALAELALSSINDGVIIVDAGGIVRFVNPAASRMVGADALHNPIGANYTSVLQLESKEGRALTEQENPLILAMKNGQSLDAFRGNLVVGATGKRIPVAISVIDANDPLKNRIITFRNIAKELEEEGAQTEFISTASHEMRTPVASIEGYLSLALNPQTATIDERAKGYLDAAHAAAKHLGKLFQDLLDVTKADDGRVKPNFVPVEMVNTVKKMTDEYNAQFNKEHKVNYTFGSANDNSRTSDLKVSQVVYASVDLNFLQEIMDNLMENAIKYTPAGGSIWVSVRGDGDRVLINVTDTGIGISADDIQHIFQKFYRADNSDTREIGGTGLGLYLTKSRVEAMGGKIWVESGFGEGSTFYVSLPRLSTEEYNKQVFVMQNQQQFMAAQAARQQANQQANNGGAI
ncbi:PAS domain-containing sensor histidine kinase [Candidatus Saccharibacteria bacterium]|nr:PAS domain-containing sensor histidine kinase [Candidatus Saccharibacteria bacterium]